MMMLAPFSNWFLEEFDVDWRMIMVGTDKDGSNGAMVSLKVHDRYGK